MGATTQIIVLTVLACGATGLLGTLVLQAVRTRSLLWSIVVAALVPVVAVTAAVVLNVQRMFISAHDSAAVSIALACASVLAVLLSFVLGRRVASGSRLLTQALRELATSRAHDHPSQVELAGATTRSSAPGEMHTLASELEATRASLRTAREREWALERSRRELVTFMSHDLRTPLAGLRALAEGLEDGVIDDVPAAMRQLRQSVERMTALVGDLLELSRLQGGAAGRPRQRVMVSLLELAGDVVGELAEHARRGGVRLRLDIADDGDRLAVLGSGDDLARVLTNLVGNAVRHTGSGGVVVIDARRAPDGRARLSVSDGCGGIDRADLDRLFDVGWRAEPARGSQDGGAGLGLAIAKGVVEAHDGSITVQNVPGGCRFEVKLPGLLAH